MLRSIGNALKSIGKALYKVASLLVGLPVGAAGAVFFSAMYLVAGFIDASLTHFKKGFNKKKQKQLKNPLSDAITKAIKGYVAASVTFMFYTEIQAFAKVTEELGKDLERIGADPHPTLQAPAVPPSDPENFSGPADNIVKKYRELQESEQPPRYEDLPPRYTQRPEENTATPPPYQERPPGSGDDNPPEQPPEYSERDEGSPTPSPRSIETKRLTRVIDTSRGGLGGTSEA